MADCPYDIPVICIGTDGWPKDAPEWIVVCKRPKEPPMAPLHVLRSNEGYGFTVGFNATGWIPVPA